jgi:hypothetical protein
VGNNIVVVFNWNIFESGVKHLTSNGQMMDQMFVYVVLNIKHIWVIMWHIFINSNISVTTFVAEIGIPREIHRPVASHWQTLSHIVLSSTPRHEWGSNSQIQLQYDHVIKQCTEKETTSLSICYF